MEREEIIRLLEKGKYEELSMRSEKDIKGMLRRLIGLTYDKDTLLCWRSIEAIGILSGRIAAVHPDIARNIVQRLLWMMRDESGNNPGSAPEILGEIVRNTPNEFADIAPIIVSFHDEEMLRRGVFRAMVRMCDIRPDLLTLEDAFIEHALKDADPAVRVYAIKLAGELKMTGLMSQIKMAFEDNATVSFYEDGVFSSVSVAHIAEIIYGVLRGAGG